MQVETPNGGLIIQLEAEFSLFFRNVDTPLQVILQNLAFSLTTKG